MARLWAGILLVGLLTGCGGSTGAPATGFAPSDVPPPDLAKRPWGLSEEFLKLVQAGNVKASYKYFSQGGRGRVSEFTFESELKSYRASHGKDLARAHVLTELIRGSRARVILGTSEETKNGWVLLYGRQEDGSWKLESCAGGPFGGPEFDQDELERGWNL